MSDSSHWFEGLADHLGSAYLRYSFTKGTEQEVEFLVEVLGLGPGTRVLAEGPYGAMTQRRRTRESVLLIAGGVGITPMRALFEELEVGDGSLTLLYRASRPDDVIFRDELEEIARMRGASIVWMIGPSADPQNKMTGANLTRLVPDVASRDVYVCASRGLSRAIRAALKDAGHPPARLHEEVFAF